MKFVKVFILALLAYGFFHIGAFFAIIAECGFDSILCIGTLIGITIIVIAGISYYIIANDEREEIKINTEETVKRRIRKMTRSEYFETAKRLYDEGKISAEAYDALWINAEEFIDEDNDNRLPKTYAEIEYTSEQLESDPIAIEGAKFDDMNYRHYMER